eukprot:6180664-Pleurochrysis_carterae.AAC.2
MDALKTTHALAGVYHDAGSHGQGAGAGAWAGRTYVGSPGLGAQSGKVGPGSGRAMGIQNLGRSAERERSAGTHAVQMQFGKLCMRASNSGAWRHFQLSYRTMCIKIGFIIPDIDIDNNIEYRYSADSVMGYNAK